MEYHILAVMSILLHANACVQNGCSVHTLRHRACIPKRLLCAYFDAPSRYNVNIFALCILQVDAPARISKRLLCACFDVPRRYTLFNALCRTSMCRAFRYKTIIRCSEHAYRNQMRCGYFDASAMQTKMVA